MTEATFDPNDHAVDAGWATYHQKRTPLRCWFRGHVYPSAAPRPANGHSPSNYTRCARCEAWMHWYVVGQHRYGGLAALPTPEGEQ